MSLEYWGAEGSNCMHCARLELATTGSWSMGQQMGSCCEGCQHTMEHYIVEFLPCCLVTGLFGVLCSCATWQWTFRASQQARRDFPPEATQGWISVHVPAFWVRTLPICCCSTLCRCFANDGLISMHAACQQPEQSSTQRRLWCNQAAAPRARCAYDTSMQHEPRAP